MKIELNSTQYTVDINGVSTRVFAGTTDAGVQVYCMMIPADKLPNPQFEKTEVKPFIKRLSITTD